MKKYEVPVMKLHQLKTARIMAASGTGTETFQAGKTLSGASDRSTFFDEVDE